jgi:hypothetical protein
MGFSHIMELHQAAERLYDELSNHRWFVSVGAGSVDEKEAIFVYVKSVRHAELSRLKSGYHGFPVVICRSGAIRPAEVSAP